MKIPYDPPTKSLLEKVICLASWGFGGGAVRFTAGPRKSPGGGPGSGAAHGSSKNPVVSNSKIGLDHGKVHWNHPNKDLMLFFKTSAACVINRT